MDGGENENNLSKETSSSIVASQFSQLNEFECNEAKE